MRQVLSTTNSRAAVLAAFGHIAAGLRNPANLETELKKVEAIVADLAETEDDHEERLTALESGIVQIAEAAGVELDTTPTDGVVGGTDTAAPISSPGAVGGAPALVLPTDVGSTPEQGVTVADIPPVDPTDDLRPGAGTLVTSPAPVSIPQSAEPVAEEAPDATATTVQTAPLSTDPSAIVSPADPTLASLGVDPTTAATSSASGEATEAEPAAS